jgi:hypothetical protein
MVTKTTRLLGSVALALAWPVVAAAQQAPPATPPPQVAVPPTAAAATPPAVAPALPADYTFPSGAGLLFFYVKPAKAADFELVLGRVKEALLKAEDPARKQQALNWKIYKSSEPVTDATIFVFAFDPALTTGNYDPLLLLAEVLPTEQQPLYDRLKDAVIKVERMGLTKIR